MISQKNIMILTIIIWTNAPSFILRSSTAFETYKTKMDQLNIFSRHGLSSSAKQFLKVHETQDKIFKILLKCKECSNIDKCLYISTLIINPNSHCDLVVKWNYCNNYKGGVKDKSRKRDRK